MSPPLVSIVMPVFNRWSLTRNCLESLANALPAEVRTEVVVVDNGSEDATVSSLEPEFGDRLRLKVVRHEKNLGFAQACNRGAAVAAGRYLLLLNNDTEIFRGWLEPLIEVLEADPAVASVGSRLLYPDRTIQHAGVLLASIEGGDPLQGVHVYSRQPANLPEANVPRAYQALSAACLAVRRSAFEKLSGLDEAFWNGYEDVDLCLRFGQEGWLNVYQPRSVAIHYESMSGPERFAKVRENVDLFHRRWLGVARADVIVDKAGRCVDSGAGRVRSYQLGTSLAAAGDRIAGR